MGRRLDLGCGTNKPDGWVGLDRVNTPEVDVVHDLCDTPLPFETDDFRQVRACNVLEHLPRSAFIDVLKEVQRITEPSGLFLVTGPHYLSHNAPAGDHYRAFSRTTFDVFTPDHEYPNQFPDLFTVEDLTYAWNTAAKTDWIIRVLRRWQGDDWVQKHVPNAFDEIRFKLRVIS